MSQSQITVASARLMLYDYVDQGDSNSPLFLKRLNEACERIINSGSWKGCVMDAFFETDTDGCIVAPYNMDSLMAVTVRKWPVPIYTEYHRYTEVGPGLVQEDQQVGGCPFYDLGDRFPTVTEITRGSSGLLRLTPADSGDNGQVVRVFGRNASDVEIFDADGNRGEDIVLATPFATSTNTFSAVTGVQKPHTKGRVTLAWVNAGTPTTLSVYYPSETVPLYHKYQIGTVEEDTDLGNRTIACKFRRRFVPMVAETDFVIPGNIGALKYALLALNSETAPSDTMRQTAQNYWNDCYRILDQQHKTTRGAARPTINYSPYGYGVLSTRNST